MTAPMIEQSPELAKAMETLKQHLVEGIAHGFFEVTITCEIVKGKKRRLVIKAGKSHQFIIAPHES